jgi:hypothetical protein
MNELYYILRTLQDGIAAGQSKYASVRADELGLVLTDKEGHELALDVVQYLK